jgi:hypothetical protein
MEENDPTITDKRIKAGNELKARIRETKKIRRKKKEAQTLYLNSTKIERMERYSPENIALVVKEILPDLPDDKRDLVMGLFLARYIYSPRWSVEKAHRKDRDKHTVASDISFAKTETLLATAKELGLKDEFLKLIFEMPILKIVTEVID